MLLCSRWEDEWFRHGIIPCSLCLCLLRCLLGTRCVLCIICCSLRHVCQATWFVHSRELGFIYDAKLLLRISHPSAVLHHVHFALSRLILRGLWRWVLAYTACSMTLIRFYVCRENPLLRLFSLNFVGCQRTQLFILSSVVRLIHLLLIVQKLLCFFVFGVWWTQPTACVIAGWQILATRPHLVVRVKRS